MSVHLTEEEQLETLKRWWKEHGKSTLAVVFISLAGFFGFKGWQDHQQQQREEASAQYQSLLEALSAGETGLSAEQKTTATHLAETLRNDFAGTIYAAQAALISARLAVDDQRLDDAATQLQWVLDHSADDEGLAAIARLRLAQVNFAQDKPDAALALLQQAQAGAFAAAYAELRGDILAATQRAEEAQTAYKLALNHLPADDAGRLQIVEMKLNNVPVTAGTAQGSGEQQ